MGFASLVLMLHVNGKKLVVNCTGPTVKCLVYLQNYKYLNARLEKNSLKLTARTLLLIKAH